MSLGARNVFKRTGTRESCWSSSSSPWPAEIADTLGGKLTKQQATACGAWPGFVGNGEWN